MTYYEDSTVTLHHGHVLDVLPTLADGSVDCVVTSPPYLGLRDYGVEGQIGLGQTPAEYITSLRDVFREVRRILTKDGTCWINLGDSMWSGGVTGLGSGVPAYGTSDTTPGDCRGDGSSSCGRCGGRRGSEPTDTRTTRTGTPPVCESTPCEPDPNRVRTESRCPSLDSSGSARRSGSPQSGPATLDPKPTLDPEPSQLHDVRVSTTRGSYPQPLGEYSRSDSHASFQSSPDSSVPDARESEHMGACICGTSRTSVPSVGHTSGRESYGSAYPDSTSVSLPPKSLLLMPHRVAMALQEDGWTLRNAIIWNRPNAMPESVTDRLSTRYEMLFMFSKSRRYWFDLDPIREDFTPQPGLASSFARDTKEADIPGQGYRQHRKDRRDPAVYGAAAGTNLQPTGARHVAVNAKGKNPGDVWEIPTTPFPGSHFAVFPPELPRRCILAGCKPRKCAECGHVPEQIIEKGDLVPTVEGSTIRTQNQSGHTTTAATTRDFATGNKNAMPRRERTVTGWSDCGHNAYRAGTVLDPFHGSGTTGMVAQKLGRKYVGIELNKDYLDLSLRTRLADGVLDFEEEQA